MARKVFFSFHYERDAWRVSQVRNSNVVQGRYDKNPFLDAAEWEKVQRTEGIKRWIDRQLEGTSVTVVLIGNETHLRPWVLYEIESSWRRGNGLLGIYVHNMKNAAGQVDIQGTNPLQKVAAGDNLSVSLSSVVSTYDWVNHNGRENIGYWIEAAAKARGK